MMNPLITQDEIVRKKLFKIAMQSNWDEVIHIYELHPEAADAKITKSQDTALHIAIADGQEEAVEKLVQKLVEINKLATALRVKNERGDTPLHLAASLGNVEMCHYIASTDATLMGIRNNENETPFFLAVLHGRKDAFLHLHGLCAPSPENEGERYGYCRRRDGETILHSAISGEYFDLAFQIMGLYPKLRNSFNEQGFEPLHILATKPSAFRTGSNIRGFEKLIYHCIFVDKLKRTDIGTVTKDQYDHKNSKYPENYQTCVGMFALLRKVTPLLLGHRRQQDEEHPKGTQTQVPTSRDKRNNQKTSIEGQTTSNDDKDESSTYEEAQGHEFFPENYFTCFHFLKLIAKAMLVILGLGSTQVVKIRIKKQKHIWSVQILEKLLKHASSYEYENNGRSPGDGGAVDLIIPESVSIDDIETSPSDNSRKNKGTTPEMEKKETAVLIAAKNGIQEMVAGILAQFPVAIHDMNEKKKNIVLLAVENRQPHVYSFLLGRKIMKETIFRKTDVDGNSALHLAAMLGDHRPWLIPGAALQMQWEIKWYEFVKNSMPLHFFPRCNRKSETPREIFNRSHRELAKEGSEWLTNTSESCSVVAALIATVAFATSATVPGGVEQESGIPTLQNQPAFGIFAISSLVALCFSVTSVVMFLAILTSRYQERDFGKDLPRKLLVGLTSLFVSIGSMLLSFCAGHFFVLKEKLKYVAFPMYAITCLPVTFFAMAQFPLYFDLVKATIKKVPQRSSKYIFS